MQQLHFERISHENLGNTQNGAAGCGLLHCLNVGIRVRKPPDAVETLEVEIHFLSIEFE